MKTGLLLVITVAAGASVFALTPATRPQALPDSGDRPPLKQITSRDQWPKFPDWFDAKDLTEQNGLDPRTWTIPPNIRPWRGWGDGEIVRYDGYRIFNCVGGHRLDGGKESPKDAIHLSCTGDNGDTFRFIELSRLHVYNVYKAVGTSAHCNAIFLRGSEREDRLANAYVHDVVVHDTGGSAMTLLVQAGRFEVFVLQRFRGINCGNRIIFGGDGGRLLVIDDYEGPSILIAGDWDNVIVKNGRGSKITASSTKTRIILDDAFPTPTFDPKGNAILTPATRPTEK